MKTINNRGINLLEIIVVIGIIALISAITIPNLSAFKKQQALKNTTEDIVSLLNEARNSTISSKNSTNYGVHFEEDQASMFSGTAFTSNSSEKQIDFDQAVMIEKDTDVNLSGGGDDIIFERLTGNTTNYGTITIRLVSDASKIRTITASSIGIISVN